MLFQGKFYIIHYFYFCLPYTLSIGGETQLSSDQYLFFPIKFILNVISLGYKIQAVFTVQCSRTNFMYTKYCFVQVPVTVHSTPRNLNRWGDFKVSSFIHSWHGCESILLSLCRTFFTPVISQSLLTVHISFIHSIHLKVEGPTEFQSLQSDETNKIW